MIHKTDVKDNFTRVQNTLLNDENISFKAKGLLVYLLSKPDAWNVKQLTNTSSDGASSVRSGLKELIDAGYIHKEIIRKNNRIAGTKYHVCQEVAR